MRTSALRTCASLLLLAATSACGDFINFDVHATGSGTVQGSGLGSLVTLPVNFGDINVSQSADFKNQDTRKDHISTAHVTKLTLRVTDPAGQDLSFLSSVAFYVQAPGLDKVRIAHAESFPKGATSVDLTLDDRDIAAYAKADSFSVVTDASGKPPGQNTTLEAALTLHITATLL